MMVISSILVLSVLVFVHELGHFLFAKLFKIGVLEFAIGFGPKLLQKQFGETTYSIRALPLGGFVRMIGDTPDQLSAPDPGELLPAELKEDPRVQALVKDRSRWFLNKPLHARGLVVFAGPLFNLIFAYLVLVFSLTQYGALFANDNPVVGDLVPYFPAEKAGILAGDKVLAINGKPIVKWDEIKPGVESVGANPVVFTIERVENGVPKQIEITMNPKSVGPEFDYVTTGKTENVKESFMIGIRPSWDRKELSFSNSLIIAGQRTVSLVWMNIRSILGIFKGIISPENLGGPLTIFREAARSAKKGIEEVLDFMVFLSVSLAVLNLLPIPVLDGGHLTFYTIEFLRRKPLSFKVQEAATKVGMALLLLLMLYALRNDIRNIFMS